MEDDTIENDEFLVNSTKPRKLIKETKVDAEKVTRGRSVQDLEFAQKNLVNIYRKEARVPVRIAPAYAKYFGKAMHVGINGIIVTVKCDGSTVEIPESFAAEVFRRMSEVDKLETRQNNMADVRNNCETSPGELNFFN